MEFRGKLSTKVIPLNFHFPWQILRGIPRGKNTRTPRRLHGISRGIGLLRGITMEHDGPPRSFHAIARVEFHEKLSAKIPWNDFRGMFSMEFRRLQNWDV